MILDLYFPLIYRYILTIWSTNINLNCPFVYVRNRRSTLWSSIYWSDCASATNSTPHTSVADIAGTWTRMWYVIIYIWISIATTVSSFYSRATDSFTIPASCRSIVDKPDEVFSKEIWDSLFDWMFPFLRSLFVYFEQIRHILWTKLNKTRIILNSMIIF